MIKPILTALLFEPTEQFVEATICLLTADLIESGINTQWWTDASLKSPLEPPPIDRDWDWHNVGIEYDGKSLNSERIGIVTGDGAVQGAMLVSREPILSVLSPGMPTPLVELLFTAPWNRRNLRRDGMNYYVGVGTELLSWAIRFSVQSGCDGRIKLDGSPDFVGWYEKRGLKKTGESDIIFEGTAYTPMELAAPEAQKLLAQWRVQEQP